MSVKTKTNRGTPNERNPPFSVFTITCQTECIFETAGSFKTPEIGMQLPAGLGALLRCTCIPDGAERQLIGKRIIRFQVNLGVTTE